MKGLLMAGPTGLEPATFGVTDRCANQNCTTAPHISEKLLYYTKKSGKGIRCEHLLPFIVDGGQYWI